VNADELVIWEGRPSHVKDLGFNLLCLLLAPLAVPLGLMLWRWLDTHYHQYGITSERLRVTKGILSKRMHEMELYRVRETSIHQPLLLRLFRLANVVVKIADPNTPPIVIRAVPEALALREQLRECVETMRDRKHVHEAA
jgi:uncharacterized membrane protein YdbT with pleckstrin-like domain